MVTKPNDGKPATAANGGTIGFNIGDPNWPKRGTKPASRMAARQSRTHPAFVRMALISPIFAIPTVINSLELLVRRAELITRARSDLVELRRGISGTGDLRFQDAGWGWRPAGMPRACSQDLRERANRTAPASPGGASNGKNTGLACSSCRAAQPTPAFAGGRLSIRSSRSSPNSSLFYAEKTRGAIEATWRRSAPLLDRFTPDECANYLANAGGPST